MRLSALGILFAAVPVFAQVKQLKVEGAPFKLTVAEWTPPERTFSIADYGAARDGSASTEAIERAIDAASAAGGGRVVVPAGEWITGAFRLKSGVALFLDRGATLRFPDDPVIAMRAPLKSDGMPTMTHWALIGAYGCTNVAVMGEGTIRCDVEYWHRNFLVDPKKGFPRPHLTTFRNCRNVRLEGFKVRGSPCWTLVLEVCEDIVIRGVDSSSSGPNVDGIDLSSCNRALVENCTLDQTDDCYTIKSGANEAGRRRGIPSENIVIRDCRAVRGHSLLGIGSEVSGGIRNVHMRGCSVAEDCWRLLFVKTNPKRGGFVENVSIENIRAKKAGQSVMEVEMFYDGNPNKELTGNGGKAWHTRIENVSAKNVVCGAAKFAVKVIGAGKLPPRGISAENIRVGKITRKLVSLHNAPDVRLSGVREDGGAEGRGESGPGTVRFPLEWNRNFPAGIEYEVAVSTAKLERLCGVRPGSGFRVRARTQDSVEELALSVLKGRAADEAILRFKVPTGTQQLQAMAGVGGLEFADSETTDNLFAGFRARESDSGWTHTVDVPAGLAGSPVALEATVENLGQLPQNAELRLYQVDDAGNTLPETVVDRRWTSHMHPGAGKVRYLERGRIHPKAKKLKLRFDVRRRDARYDLYGMELTDPKAGQARFRVSAVAVRPAALLPFPAYDEGNFRPGVSGDDCDRSFALGGWDERAFWFQTRSSASWAGGNQLRREEELFYPAGAGTAEAWFKSAWTPAPVRGLMGKVVRERPITLFQCYQSFRAKEYKVGKGAVMELKYTPERKLVELEMLERDGRRVRAEAKVELPRDRWFHLAVEWTPGGKAHVYVDGRRRLEMPIPGVAAQVLDRSVKFPNDEGGHEFYLGSSWQSARAKAESDPEHPFFQGAADNLRISSGCRYGGDFTPSKKYGCDGLTRAFFDFNRSFDGVSGGGSGWVRATTRSLGCGRTARTLDVGSRLVGYFPDRPAPENDPRKVFSVRNYLELPSEADFAAMRRPFTVSRKVSAGERFEIDFPKGALQDYIEIANVSGWPLKFPVVLGDGECDPRSYGDVADSLGLGRMAPKDRVNRLFQYMLGASDYFIQHTAMFERGSDAPVSVQSRPMMMHNGYCGFECGPLNNMAANLFVNSGRCPAGLTAGYAHEFQQVFYGGKNHIYDLSAQKFFPAADNETAAYLEEGGDEAGIFPRMGSAAEHFIRKSTRDVWLNPPDMPAKIGVTLNPGESFRVWQVNDGGCNDLICRPRTGVYRGYASHFHPEYDRECHADASKRFLQRVERFFPHYLNGFIVFDGRPDKNNPAFAVSDGSFCYRVDAGGYPIVAAEYRAVKADGGEATLEISTDGGRTFRKFERPATYAVRARCGYLIRVCAPIESVVRFCASTEVQLNPRVFPGRIKGGKNGFVFKCAGLGAAEVSWRCRRRAGTVHIPAAVSSGAIKGVETLFYAFDSNRRVELDLECRIDGGKASPVTVRSRGIDARYENGRLFLADAPAAKAHFGWVTIECGGAEKTLTVLSGDGVRFVNAAAAELAPGAAEKLTFEPVGEGRYAVLNLNRFKSGAGGGAGLYLNWPGRKPFGFGFAKNPACNFKKADFGKAGGWANFKWDYSPHPETSYPFMNMRVSRLDAAGSLTVENRSGDHVVLGAVLIVPDPDAELRAELIKYLCGLNSDPDRIRRH